MHAILEFVVPLCAYACYSRLYSLHMSYLINEAYCSVCLTLLKIIKNVEIKQGLDEIRH
jgi:hypothetical protein